MNNEKPGTYTNGCPDYFSLQWYQVLVLVPVCYRLHLSVTIDDDSTRHVYAACTSLAVWSEVLNAVPLSSFSGIEIE